MKNKLGLLARFITGQNPPESSDFNENNIALIRPDIGSGNIGDEIIAQAIMEHLNVFFPNAHILHLSSQTGMSAQTVLLYNHCYRHFACGANLLNLRPLPFFNPFALTLLDFWKMHPMILVGSGCRFYQSPTLWAGTIWRRLLDRDFVHSVRDEYSRQALSKLGIHNVINTGCPTTWNLTPEHCAKIPKTKANTVVCTLSAHATKYDVLLLRILKKEYERVFFFPQGFYDLQFFAQSGEADGIQVLPGNLDAFDNFLEAEDCDYIGMRLHGGVRALQKQRRTIIVAFDNRAIEIHRDIQLPIVMRDQIENYLLKKINSDWETILKVNFTAIEQWKKQFL